MPGRLSGHRALVTGGAGGIGRAIALTLAREGADVGIGYLTSAGAAKAVVAGIRASGVRATAIRGDVTREADVKRLVTGTARALGDLDILVNNVGNFFVKDYDLTTAQARRRKDPETAAGRPGTAQDVANAVAFLCSDEAEFVTGDVLNVTGGWLL